MDDKESEPISLPTMDGVQLRRLAERVASSFSLVGVAAAGILKPLADMAEALQELEQDMHRMTVLASTSMPFRRKTFPVTGSPNHVIAVEMDIQAEMMDITTMSSTFKQYRPTGRKSGRVQVTVENPTPEFIGAMGIDEPAVLPAPDGGPDIVFRVSKWSFHTNETGWVAGDPIVVVEGPLIGPGFDDP